MNREEVLTKMKKEKKRYSDLLFESFDKKKKKKPTLKQKIRRKQSDIRYKEATFFLVGTSLDVGCEWIRNEFTECCDLYPKEQGIIKQDAHNLAYVDNQFDTVCCLECLEHLPNPVKAIRELKRVAKKRIIISIPNEPWFTILRGCSWNKEHLWGLTPMLLEFFLGKPIFNKVIAFRWRIMVWDMWKEDKNG